jgi:hypothetical protein
MARRQRSEESDDSGAWEDLFDGVSEASDARALSRGLAFGFLAMTPLFALYELGAAGSARRSAAELILLRPFAPLGDELPIVRATLLGVLTVVALTWCLRRHLALGPPLVRVPVEGLLGALLLGPATALLMQVFGVVPLTLASDASASIPAVERAAFVAGAAAYEEVVFRVGLFSLIWLIVRRVFVWLGAGDRAARWSAEAVAPIGSALLFAAFHLEACLRHFGPGGEPFDAAVFAWRTLAGVLLALLFRWRGPGVAAWTHACFNVSLLLGAGPRVFL